MKESAATMRCFVAIDIAPLVHDRLKVLWQELQRELPDSGIAWVKPQNWHLTLLFLGDVPMAQIEQAQNALSAACAGVAPFELAVEGIGVFPNTRRPKVLWAGVRGDVEALQTLQSRIAQEMRPFVVKRDDKSFHPHLTLARIKYADKVLTTSLERSLSAPQRGLGAWTVDNVRLMQSELKPSGAVYSVVHNVVLVTAHL